MDKIKKLLSVYRKLGFFVGTLQIIKMINSHLALEFNYQKWIRANEPDAAELEKQRHHKFAKSPKISIVIPMYKTREDLLTELVDGFKAQTYENWELCLADGSPAKNPKFEEITGGDKRIKYKYLGRAGGISENTNAALKMVTGSFVGFMDHDDLIPPFSLYEIVKAINEHPKADYIYTDEDKLFEGRRKDPHFKPDYSPDLLQVQNYISHFSLVRKSVFDKIGGLRSQYDGAQDLDFTMRALAVSREVVHIPKVLYHWRVTAGSTALAMDNKTYAITAGLNATLNDLKSRGINAKGEVSDKLGVYQIRYLPKDQKAKVSILAPHLTDRLKASIKAHTNYQNYEIVTKPEDIDGDFVVYLGGDQEIKTDDFIENLIGYFQDDGIGLISAKLVDRKYNLISAGYTVIDKKVVPRLKGYSGKLLWYFGKGDIVEDVLAVSADCYAVRAKDFNTKKDIFKVCVGLNQDHKRVVVTPNVVSMIYEPQEVKTKTSRICDPFYSPNFKDANFKIDPGKIKK